jgi:hypothetical protein
MVLDNRGEMPPFLLIGAVLLAVGAGLFTYGQSAVDEEQEALENAVEIEVEILETDIETRERATSDRATPDDNDDAVGEQPEFAYRPVVEFSYEYEGEQYRSSNLYPGSGSFTEYDDRASAEDDLSGYTDGSTATGYVDPNDPGEAFLIAEESGSPPGIILVGALFVLMGAFGVLVGGGGALKTRLLG